MGIRQWDIGNLIIGCILVGAVVGIMFLVVASQPYDDSDNPPHRSGLRIYTDTLTGCQYVRAAGGGITPRIDAEGKPLCHKKH